MTQINLVRDRFIKLESASGNPVPRKPRFDKEATRRIINSHLNKKFDPVKESESDSDSDSSQEKDKAKKVDKLSKSKKISKHRAPVPVVALKSRKD